jgi:hypothetical protein
VKTDILYPLFFYRRYSDSYKWSILQLVNHDGILDDVTKAGGPTDKHFDLWPFYFSHETADPIDTYHGLFPIYGTIKYRLGFDRLSWVLFPLYRREPEKGHAHDLRPLALRAREAGRGKRVRDLAAIRGHEGARPRAALLLPLAPHLGQHARPAPRGAGGKRPRDAVRLHPLLHARGEPPVCQRELRRALLRVHRPHVALPLQRKRYFWPFVVQGRGDVRNLDRWGPFLQPFQHQGHRLDVDRLAVLAPDDVGRRRHPAVKDAVLLFPYWSLDETSEDHPSWAPAYKRHIWPLVSIWDNGAGSRQVLVPSLTEVFFPDNPDIRAAWAPLFSVYRFDRQPTGETRSSLLWDAVTWRRDATRDLVEFHLGPVLGMRRRPSGRAGAS